MYRLCRQGGTAVLPAAAAVAQSQSTALQRLLQWAAGALFAAGAATATVPHEPARCDAGGMPAPSAEPPLHPTSDAKELAVRVFIHPAFDEALRA